MRYQRLIFRVHAAQRMFSRGISDTEVRDIVENGEVIEEYPDDLPYPSRLMLGFVDGRPLHVVVSEDDSVQATVIVTVYEPDPKRWDKSFRRRKP